MEDKEIKDFISDIYNLVVDANNAEISILNEDNNLCNWIIGLASGGAFFILSRITSSNTTNTWFITTFVLYFACLIIALVNRIFSKKIFEKINLIIVAYSFQKSEIVNNINLVKKEISEFKHKSVQTKFLDFEYIPSDSMVLINKITLDYYGKVHDISLFLLYILFISECVFIFITFLSII